MPRRVCNRCRCQPCACPRGKASLRLAEARGSADTFEMAASYADGRHYVETSTSELDAMLSAKEHIEQPGCDYVRIMRQREYPQNEKLTDAGTKDYEKH